MEEFVETMKNALIKVYVQEYGVESWNQKTATEKSETLHRLLMAFLNVAKNQA